MRCDMDRKFEIFRPGGAKGSVRLACRERAIDGADEKAPVVVLCHGFTDRMGTEPLESVARALLERGFQVVQFDFNGHGESGGTFEEMTVSNEVLDTLAVLERYAERRKVLVGHSQGGVVAALAAARATPGTVEALVLLAPGSVLRDDAQRGRIFDAVFDPADPPESVPVMGGKFTLGRGYIVDAQGLKIYEEFAGYSGRLCVIHGTGDRVVPWCCGEHFIAERTRSGGGEGDVWRLLPRADHNFAGHETEVAGIVAGFLQL